MSESGNYLQQQGKTLWHASDISKTELVVVVVVVVVFVVVFVFVKKSSDFNFFNCFLAIFSFIIILLYHLITWLDSHEYFATYLCKYAC